MHVVAEQRAIVGVGIEVEVAASRAELLFDRFENLVPVMNERIVVRPHLVNDFHAGVMAMGVDGDEPAARAQRLGKRGDHALGFEVERGARAVGLRGDHQVVIGHGAAGARNDRIEQELVVGAIDHQHDRPLVHGVAGLG